MIIIARKKKKNFHIKRKIGIIIAWLFTAGILAGLFNFIAPNGIRASATVGWSQYNILTDSIPNSIELNKSNPYPIIIENDERIDMQTGVEISIIPKDDEINFNYECDNGGCPSIFDNWKIPSGLKGNIILNLTIGQNPMYDNYTIRIKVWESGRKSINNKEKNYTFTINREEHN